MLLFVPGAAYLLHNVFCALSPAFLLVKQSHSMEGGKQMPETAHCRNFTVYDGDVYIFGAIRYLSPRSSSQIAAVPRFYFSVKK